jgi:hypothetical protein
VSLLEVLEGEQSVESPEAAATCWCRGGRTVSEGSRRAVVVLSFGSLDPDRGAPGR